MLSDRHRPEPSELPREKESDHGLHLTVRPLPEELLQNNGVVGAWVRVIHSIHLACEPLLPHQRKQLFGVLRSLAGEAWEPRINSALKDILEKTADEMRELKESRDQTSLWKAVMENCADPPV